MKAPHARLLQLAATFLVVFYMLFIGGTFDATVRFRVQLLNAVAATTAAALWLVVRLRQRARLRATGLEWPVLVFVLTQWVATATSAQPRLSLEAIVNITAWAIAFVVLCDLLASGWPRQYVNNALLGVAAILAFQALWEVGVWFAQWAALGQFPPTAFRLAGWLGHPNLTAAVLNLLMPIVLAQWMTTPPRAARVALGALFLAMLAAEFFTSSRAGWIACAVALGLFTALALWERRAMAHGWLTRARRAPLWLRGLSLALMLAALVVAGWLLVRQTQHPSHSSFLDSRRFIWASAWAEFVAHPLLGSGPDLYAWFYSAYESIPPVEMLPHAHSLMLQLLGGSGLVGLGAALAVLAASVRQAMRCRPSPSGADGWWWTAFAAALGGAVVHHLFDYFLTSPAFVFLGLTLGALALTAGGQPPRKTFSPWALAAPLAVIVGFAAFAFRATALHETGLQLAERQQWAEAGRAFQRAAEADPGLGLYWAEAAQALTHANDFENARALWERAIQADVTWSMWPATLALINNDPLAMEAAAAHAAHSSLLVLNVGALWEARAAPIEARAAYTRALTLDPALARALFWVQTPLRSGAVAQWRMTQSADTSAVARGWGALEAGQTAEAIHQFQQARANDPLNSQAYVGLARAQWAAGDDAQAKLALDSGRLLPVHYDLSAMLDLLLLQGDWDVAHGDRAGAMAMYGQVFSAYNDYGSSGPGSYGYAWRSWIVFHKDSLPSDLVPQFVHADITPEMDAAFAQLAHWLAADGNLTAACLVVERVNTEAPKSKSGELKRTLCP